MASIYKKPIKVTDPKTGQKVKAWSRKWWGRYRNERGIEKRVPLAIDKSAAVTMLNELVRKAERIASGIVDRFDEHRKRPIKDHLADFEKHLRAKEITSEQVKLVTSRARLIVRACNFALIGDISSSGVQKYLAALRASGKSVQTSNHYLRAIKQFSRWLVKDRRAADDPLAYIAMLNVSMDRRHDRRPLSDEEMSRILQATNAGPTIRHISGSDRAMLYAVAGFTGLRASELASLTPESFDMNGTPPNVIVEAAYSKHRRQDVLPLHPSLVALLRPWLASKPARQPVWPGNWAKGKEAGVIFKIDLSRAQTTWINEAGDDEAEWKRREQSSFLAYKDENGRYADFHALRHTFITNMVKSGIAPKVAQMLARHSTIDLTMNVYTSLTVHDQASALASLPPVPALIRTDIGTPPLRATGT